MTIYQPDLYCATEEFSLVGRQLNHTLQCGGVTIDSWIAADPSLLSTPDPKGEWWKAYLRGAVPNSSSPSGVIRTVDLFCGPGGLALGVGQLAAELGVDMVSELICDQDEGAVAVYSANHSTRLRSTNSVTSLVDFRWKGRSDQASFTYEPEIIDPLLADALPNIDLVMAGPPCQGHSNLNNHTRRTDKRNELYMTVPAFTFAVGARMAIIENVPTVVRDRMQVVETARALFESAGYRVATGVFGAHDMGWPQTRKRFFMVAHREADPIPFADISRVLSEARPRSLLWAIGDLADRTEGSIMYQPADLSSENRARIDWLFDNNRHELPPPKRPPSHQNGTSYGSVYGRMLEDRPAPTLTTGFMSPGRGRYVHPTRRRTLTLREAARIQGFPDNYRFVVTPKDPPPRTRIAQWIGNAVPMSLGYAAALSVLAVDQRERWRT